MAFVFAEHGVAGRTTQASLPESFARRGGHDAQRCLFRSSFRFMQDALDVACWSPGRAAVVFFSCSWVGADGACCSVTLCCLGWLLAWDHGVPLVCGAFARDVLRIVDRILSISRITRIP